MPSNVFLRFFHFFEYIFPFTGGILRLFYFFINILEKSLNFDFLFRSVKLFSITYFKVFFHIIIFVAFIGTILHHFFIYLFIFLLFIFLFNFIKKNYYHIFIFLVIIFLAFLMYLLLCHYGFDFKSIWILTYDFSFINKSKFFFYFVENLSSTFAENIFGVEDFCFYSWGILQFHSFNVKDFSFYALLNTGFYLFSGDSLYIPHINFVDMAQESLFSSFSRRWCMEFLEFRYNLPIMYYDRSQCFALAFRPSGFWGYGASIYIYRKPDFVHLLMSTNYMFAQGEPYIAYIGTGMGAVENLHYIPWEDQQ